MRIALFSTYDTRGGAARAAYRLHQGLRQLGNDSAMLTRFKLSSDPHVHAIKPATDEAMALYVPAIGRMLERLIHQNRTSISNTHFSLPYPGFDLTQHAITRQADVLNLHWISSMISPEGVTKLHGLRKPLVWTLHDQRPFTGGCHFSAGCTGYERSCSACPQLDEVSSPLPEKFHQHAARSLPAEDITLVSPSRWLAACASRSKLFRHSRVEHIPYGLDLECFRNSDKSAARRKLGLPQDALCLLFGADTFSEKRKGMRELLKALTICLEEPKFKTAVAQRRLCLFCFGGLPDDQVIPGLPVNDLGHIDSDELLASAYVAADLFLFSSLEDNLPNTILESMSCGTPVLATAVGGVPELVESGRNGLLVPAGDVGAYAAALLGILDQGKQLELWGRNARQMMDERHSLSIQARRYQTLFEDLLKTNGRAAEGAEAKRTLNVNTNVALSGPPSSGSACARSVAGAQVIAAPLASAGDVKPSPPDGAQEPSAAKTASSIASAPTKPLPISVVIPTLNVRHALPEHLASVRSWAHRVQQITVVDSFSKDGTVEFVRAELHHPNLTIVQCPPGLYASWNHGIEQNTSEFSYISTIRDTISAAGLEHMVNIARGLKADVVISPPVLMEENGRRLPEKKWPVHEIIEACAIQHPILLPKPLAFLLATLYIPECILGSSASNLYRTQVLRQFPFPTDFGSIGDTAWGVRHTLRASIALTPESFSRFVFHRTHAWASEAERDRTLRRLLDLARQAISEEPGRRLGDGFANMGHVNSIVRLVQALPDEVQLLHEAQGRYDRARRERRPWIFSLEAWRARSHRNRQRHRLSQAQADLWQLLQADPQMLSPLPNLTQ
jgi:glycosyltransferase involved in cell wall biosynthesis